MKFNAIDYGYDEVDGMKLISNLVINLSKKLRFSDKF